MTPAGRAPGAPIARRYGLVLGVGAAVVVLDQLTKWAVRRFVELHDSIPIVDGMLNLVHARNPGAAFSLFADAPAWFRGPFFVSVTIVAVGLLFYVASRLPQEERLLRLALGGVLGGAIGNLIDRLAFGEVVDFVDVHWRSHHWPAFNVADSAISVAVTAVLLQALFGQETSRKHEENPRDASLDDLRSRH